MNLKKIITVNALFIFLIGIFLNLFGFNLVNNQIPKELNANSEDSRRLYVWIENAMDKDGWGDEEIFIYYSGPGVTSPTWSSRPQMNLILGAFEQGIFYYDVPAATTSFEISAWIGESGNGYFVNEWQKSDIVTLGAGNRFKTFKLIDSYNGGSHSGRPGMYEDTLQMSSTQFVNVINKIDSCSASYASGYNHFKDLLRIFLYSDDTYTTRIMTEINFNNLDTENFSDVAYNQTFSLISNRTLTISVATKLDVLREKYNSANSTNYNSFTHS